MVYDDFHLEHNISFFLPYLIFDLPMKGLFITVLSNQDLRSQLQPDLFHDRHGKVRFPHGVYMESICDLQLPRLIAILDEFKLFL